MNVPITPLDEWIGKKAGISSLLTRNKLNSYQLGLLKKTLEHVKNYSPFYRDLLKNFGPNDLKSISDLRYLPTIDQSDIRDHGARMVCVNQDEVARIITMQSSGTTGNPKRLFFSENDLETTIDFFTHGMSAFVDKGDTVFIMLPGQTPDSTGDLLARALARFGAGAEIYGLVSDPADALDMAIDCDARFLVGFPVQVLAMARLDEYQSLGLDVSGVLLCSDYIPQAAVNDIGRIWDCRVFSHYGTVETGLGGAVECLAVAGAHIRAADLVMEILDDSGNPLPQGEWGEITVTTLTRMAMPLIRYRTGDIGRIIPGPCPCGSAIPRLDKVRGRMSGRLNLPGFSRPAMAELDENLLSLSSVLDFKADLVDNDCHPLLEVSLTTLPGKEDASKSHAEKMLKALFENSPGLKTKVSARSWTGVGISRGKRIITKRD